MFMYIVTLLVGWLTWTLLKALIEWRKKCVRFSTVPVISANHWFWGFTNTITTLDGLMNVCIKDMDKTSPKWLATRMSCFIYTLYPISPSTVKVVCNATDVPKHHGIEGAYRMIKPWIGDGLLVSNGKKWERNRHLLTPAFHFDILKPYVGVINKVADLFLGNITHMSKTGTSVDIYPLVSRATLDTMLRCTVSYNDESVQSANNNHPYVVAVHRLSTLLTNRALSIFMLFDWIYNMSADGKEFKRLCEYTQQFSRDLIEARRQSIELDPSQLDKRHLDFLDILITAKDDDGLGLTQQEIRDQVDTFMFEGHDTTASAVSWAINSLANYPEFQDKVRQEVNQLLDGRQYLTADDLSKLKYTTCFIKETLRMYSPVPATARKLIHPLTIDGVTFEPGDNININPYLVNHNPAIWDNHMIFNPDRFLPENTEGRDPYAFLAFSAGQRNCIGQHFALNEIKILVTRLATRFKIRSDPDKTATPYMEIVMRAKDGIHLHFEEIQ